MKQCSEITDPQVDDVSEETVKHQTAFDGKQFDRAYDDGVESHYWSVARNKIVQRLVSRVQGDRTNLILDIGCGRGITVNYLQKTGHQILGCDLGTPRPIFPELSPSLHLGIDAFDLDAETRDSVRTILLLDVLEHLEDDSEFLLKCRQLFKNCKQFIVTVPARAEIWSNWDEEFGHFRRYNLTMIDLLAKRSGLTPRRTGYFFHLQYPVLGLMRVLGRKRNKSTSVPTSRTKWLHKALAAYFDLEQCILHDRLLGSSLYAILRVQDSDV